MRFQFSIRDLLIATGLIAVGICGGVYAIRHFPPETFGEALLLYFVSFGAAGSAGAGIYQLFHKPLTGIRVGWTVALWFLILLALFLLFFFRHGS